jgi:S1-C subfamily serine protease
MLAAPPVGAQAPGLVDCLDELRGLVVRQPSWQCEGRVLSAEEAEAWRDRLRTKRLQRLRQSEDATGPSEVRATGTGTGFRVDPEGHVLTNRHVVEGCRRLHLRQDGRSLGDARVLALHPALDVALLAGGAAGPFARFAASATEDRAVRLSIVGYPVEGRTRVEASLIEAAVAPGTLAGSDAHFRFLGDLRPGNSGSPLLDEWGRVVGMAMARRDRVADYAKTGRLPPSGGLAIAAPRLRAFLAERGVAAATRPRGDRALADPLAEARRYVMRIDCWR